MLRPPIESKLLPTQGVVVPNTVKVFQPELPEVWHKHSSEAVGHCCSYETELGLRELLQRPQPVHPAAWLVRWLVNWTQPEFISMSLQASAISRCGEHI